MSKIKIEQSFGFLVKDISRLMRREFDRRIQDLGLTQAQWQVLVRLTYMEGAKQSELAECLEMRPISVARLIDRMEAAGWVERKPDPDDRRAVNLFLTKKAEPILDKMWDRAAQTRKIAAAGIPKDEQDKLVALLQKMRVNLIENESKHQ